MNRSVEGIGTCSAAQLLEIVADVEPVHVGVKKDVRRRLAIDGTVHVSQGDVGLAGPAVAGEEKGAAADAAEAALRLRGRYIPTDIVFAFGETELLICNSKPGHEGCAVGPSAEFAVAVRAPLGWTIDLEAHRAAKATA